VAVRAGAPKPEVRSVEDFKQVVLKAETGRGAEQHQRHFPHRGEFFRGSASPAASTSRPTPRGSGAAAMVANGEADIGSCR
jgi:hypothetical protein